MSTHPVITREVTVNLEAGLHMRPISQIKQVAQKYDCQVNIRKDGRAVSSQNMMEMLTLVAVQGTRLSLEASGPQAEVALDELVQLFETDFGAELEAEAG